ncbi:hypothetical protein HU200_056384 [Digitaria exilis]|uniref:SecA family profile domain-containing protein n=1 Tax=Digitaria exilis TaxID=1010633 RepID=A0A835AD41_9POAL|nr:hypothetical protein HU200_056384 [Digitaria exilis]
MSLGMMVTRLAWMAQRLVSSKRPTSTAWLWKRRSVLKSWAISRTRRWKGSLRIRSSVLFWYLRISRSATVPGLYLWGFFTPPVVGADFLAACTKSSANAGRREEGSGEAWAAGDAWTEAVSCDRWGSPDRGGRRDRTVGVGREKAQDPWVGGRDALVGGVAGRHGSMTWGRCWAMDGSDFGLGPWEKEREESLVGFGLIVCGNGEKRWRKLPVRFGPRSARPRLYGGTVFFGSVGFSRFQILL